MEAKPITSDEAAILFAPYGVETGAAAIAVSGGPDSMALAFCLRRFFDSFLSSPRRRGSHLLLKENGIPAFAGMTEGGGQQKNPFALIVEHGLREESAAEAQEVAERLRGMGLVAEILPWQHEPIESCIHVKARAARYALLLKACKKHNIKTLFLAHHADDQAETVLMRFAKGSGIDGLAGMAPRSEKDGVILARPFLSLPKARLVATCKANAIPFVTDPSNEKEKYARGRLRQVMPLLEQEGLTAQRLVDLADRAREAKEALDHYTYAFLRHSVAVMDSSGALTVPCEALADVPRAVALRALAACLTTLHPTPYAPERRPLVALMDWLLASSQQKVRTFHGCLVQKKEGGKKVVLVREVGAMTGDVTLSYQETALWDGRWRVTLLEDQAGLTLRPLGLPPHALLDVLAPTLRRQIPSARARASLPALWNQDRLVAIPSFDNTNQAVAVATLVSPFWLVWVEKASVNPYL